MEFRILGPLEVIREGQPVALGGAKPRALLAILLLHANRVVPNERLSELLWGEDAPASAEHAIQVYVSQLRRVLEPSGPPYRTLVKVAGGYALKTELENLDATQFQMLVESAKRSAPEHKVAQLNQALKLRRGPALSDFAGELFAVAEVSRLEEMHLNAIEERLEAELALGRHREVIAELAALVHTNPTRERLTGQLMVALYRSGRQAEASDAYQSLRARLVEELGMEPGPELQRLLKRILQQDPTLDGPAITEGLPVGERTNLPAQLMSFIGREEQLAQIGAAISTFRLVTLAGVGGSGKTRLALQVAGRLLDKFTGGVWFIDLAPVADRVLIWQSLATAIGIREQPAKPLQTTVKEVLRTRPSLLVLDNCEHLIDAVAEASESLLVACPNVHILATSRERMKVAGEHLYEVPPLNVPGATDPDSFAELIECDAVRLFADRASMARASFSVTRANASAVAEVCRRLDGIPLGIELAAARAHVLTPQELLVRLQGSLDVLKTDSHSAIKRQRTLQLTMDWSYQLLSSEEQDLFDELSVFAGDFGLAAAEAVGGRETLDLLGALIDKSLVVTHSDDEGGMRYRLLEVLRQYGQAHLVAKDSLDATRQRHAGYYKRLAQDADRQGSNAEIDQWLSPLRREEGNFRAALDWLRSQQSKDGLSLATALSRYWKATGQVTEGRFWLEAMMSAGSDDPSLVSVALYRAGLFAYYAGDNDAAWDQMNASVELKRRLGDDGGVAHRLGSLAQVAMARHDEASAVQLAAEGQALSARLADARAEAWANVHLAFIEIIRENGDLATRLLNDSLPALRSADDYAGQAYVIGGLGLVDIDNGDVQSARSRFAEMFDLVELHALWNENAGWLWGGALLAEAEGRYEAAVRVAGAIRQRESEGKVWHIRFTTRYRPAIDRSIRSVKAEDTDRLLLEGATMSNSELIAEGLGSQSAARFE